MELGKQLDSAVIQRGLLELNNDLVFDVANKLEEWGYVLHTDPIIRQWYEQRRMPVCYREKFICSLDRGMVPEFKIWELEDKWTEVECAPDGGGADLVSYERCSNPQDRDWGWMMEKVKQGHPAYEHVDNTITRYFVHKPVKVKKRPLLLGWRHTFDNIIQFNVPGVTKDTVGAKFDVDMYKFPMGTPEEIREALRAE